jgi:hypothetical protein
MTAQRTHFRSWDEELAHRQAVIRKLEKLKGLESLLAEWESQPQDSDEYRAYLLELRAKLRSVRTQYLAMRP